LTKPALQPAGNTMTDTTFAPAPPIEPGSDNNEKPWDAAAMSPHKLGLVGALALATLVPNFLISGLIEERETRQEAVRKEFARNWGPQQQLLSPVLVVPY